MNARATKRADDMAFSGRIMREGKGKYVCMIVFTTSKRHYHDEEVDAPNAKRVREIMQRMYPTLSFGKAKPKLKTAKPKKLRKPRKKTK